MDENTGKTKKAGPARTIGWSLALVCVLALCAVGGRFHREIRGMFVGARAAWSGDETVLLKLWGLGRPGIPGCRLAYRFSKSEKVKEAAAQAMGMCGGTLELAELAESEGPGSPAEQGLAEVVAFYFRVGPEAPPGACVLREGDGKPPAGVDDGGQVRPAEVKKLAVAYSLGIYEVEVQTRWSRHVRYSGGPGRAAKKSYGPWENVGGSWSMLTPGRSGEFRSYGGGRRISRCYSGRALN